jgi:hypothetical protein
MFRRITCLIILLALSLSMFACQAKTTPEPTQPAVVEPTQPPAEAQPTDSGLAAPSPTPAPAGETPTGKAITLATTGFTRDSGLLKLLLKDFTAKTGIPVNVVVRVNPNQVLEEIGRAHV